MPHVSLIREPVALATDQLPDLVTFSDVGVPKSALRVDPNNLEAIFGHDVKWRSMTIEVTGQPLTTGIETKLPWLKTMSGVMYLEGETIGNGPKSTFPKRLIVIAQASLAVAFRAPRTGLEAA